MRSTLKMSRPPWARLAAWSALLVLLVGMTAAPARAQYAAFNGALGPNIYAPGFYEAYPNNVPPYAAFATSRYFGGYPYASPGYYGGYPYNYRSYHGAYDFGFPAYGLYNGAGVYGYSGGTSALAYPTDLTEVDDAGATVGGGNPAPEVLEPGKERAAEGGGDATAAETETPPAPPTPAGEPERPRPRIIRGPEA